MLNQPTSTAISKEIELALSQIDCLNFLPCVVKSCLSRLVDFKLTPSELAEMIGADPAMALKVFLLAKQEGEISGNIVSIDRLIEKIPLRKIRDAVLAAKLYEPLEKDGEQIRLRKQFGLYSLAVAVCSREIAELMSGQVNPQAAYMAGLLHNLGNFAIEQAMPRSFVKIVEEAKEQKASITSVQQKHLGLDYTIAGKRLAERWGLPQQIVEAIWLHRSDSGFVEKISQNVGIVNVVRLGGIIARMCGYESGDYDSVELPMPILNELGIEPKVVDGICEKVKEKVSQKASVLGLDQPDDLKGFFDVIYRTAGQLAQETSELSQQSNKFQVNSNYLDFVKGFVTACALYDQPIDILESFAVRWREFYHTGKVCAYIMPADNAEVVEAVVIDAPAKSKKMLLKKGEGELLPNSVLKRFSILSSSDYVGWLYKQVDFDISSAKTAPLISDGRIVGAVIFEMRYPLNFENFEQKFEMVCTVAAKVMERAMKYHCDEELVERLSQMPVVQAAKEPEPQVSMQKPQEQQEPQPQKSDAGLLESLAEVAAGAAHELNNPLLVISGRVQLLNQTETDPDKKRMLQQIKENADEVSAIVTELMNFAQPSPPRKTVTAVKQIVDEAIQLASFKAKVDSIDTQIEIADDVKDVFVDSAQAALAVANVIVNAIESYEDEKGQVKITADLEDSDNFVRLEITDFGYGMDERTLEKAIEPFFSIRPAGRKRGMGLAHTNRLVQLNGGKLKLESHLGEGSTVTIMLPVS